MPFNLEQFKSGTPAYTRDGRKATFIGICEDCSKSTQLVIKLSGSTHPTPCYLNGEYSNARTTEMDLVFMQGSFDHIKPGEPVMVWNNDTSPLKAELRLFVEPRVILEITMAGVRKPLHHHSDIYHNCLTVQTYINTYLM